MTLATEPSSTIFGRFKIKKVKDVSEDRGFLMLIYGPPGVGKTTLCGTVIDSIYGAPALILDVDGGSHVISHLDIDIPEDRNWTYDTIVEFINILKTTKAEDIPWKTIIIDNLSVIQKLDILKISGSSQPSWPEYGESQRNIETMIRDLQSLSKMKGINVFVIAWDDTDKDDLSGIIKQFIGLTPKLAKAVHGMVDSVGIMTVDDKPPYTRTLSFAPNRKAVTKTRFAQNNSMTKVPLNIFNPSLGSILDTVKGGKPWPTEKHAPPKTEAK